jgi:Fe2+ transport system protein FeoA
MTIKPLSEMKPGEIGRISRIGGVGKAHRRILDMGVVPQTTVTVERVAPMGDPIWIKLKGYHLSLRSEEAANVYVQVEVI